MENLVNEAAVASLVDVVYRHPRHRELYYGILAHCEEEQTVEDTEAFAEQHVDYRSSLQNAATLIDVMIAEGGLTYAEYDAEGNAITEDRLEALRVETAEQWLEEHPEDIAESLGDNQAFQDAYDDACFELVARRTLQTTAVGMAVVELLDPVKRISAYVASRPERSHLYLQVLDFCQTPRTLAEVDALIKDDPALDPTAASDWQRIRPSYILDRLAEAGGLAWNEGWFVTEAAKEYLAQQAA